MPTPDLNQLTISGRVEREPTLSEHPDYGTEVCLTQSHSSRS